MEPRGHHDLSASLNPDAFDFTPKRMAEENKSVLNTEAASYEPTIEIYQTERENHIKQAGKFEGKYGLLNVIFAESFATYDANEDSWTTYTEWTSKNKVPEGKYSRIVMTGPNSFVVTGGFSQVALKHSHHVEIKKEFGESINLVAVYEMNEARYLHCAVLFNSSVYVIGGQSSAKTYSSHVEAFENGQWVSKAPLNQARSQAAAFCNNSSIWVAGGFAGPAELVQSLEKFNGSVWVNVEVALPMLAGMTSLPRDKFNTSYLVLGGSDGNNVSDRVLVFNTETSSFEVESFKLLLPRAGAVACWFGSKFWVVGGGQSNVEVWSNGAGREARAMPVTVYNQIESAAFVRPRD